MSAHGYDLSTTEISTDIDPTPVRHPVTHGVERHKAVHIVGQATYEWQHGNTMHSPMRVAMDYVAGRRRANRAQTAAELEWSVSDNS